MLAHMIYVWVLNFWACLFSSVGNFFFIPIERLQPEYFLALFNFWACLLSLIWGPVSSSQLKMLRPEYFVAHLVLWLLIYQCLNPLKYHLRYQLWHLVSFHILLQNVNQCLQNACVALNITSCAEFIDCGYGINEQVREKRQQWLSDSTSQGCFDTTSGSYKYGIYEQAVLLTAEPAVNRYMYSLFWGFQVICSLFIWLAQSSLLL
jgi:hypothetical protein